AGSINGPDGRIPADAGHTMAARNLQVPVGHIVVADPAVAIAVAGHRGVLPHVAPAVHDVFVARVAVQVGAVRHLQVAVRLVVVGDVAEACGGRGDRGILADVARAVH